MLNCSAHCTCPVDQWPEPVVKLLLQLIRNDVPMITRALPGTTGEVSDADGAELHWNAVITNGLFDNGVALH